MTQEKLEKGTTTSRRDFLKQASAAAVAAGLLEPAAKAKTVKGAFGHETIGVALVGCGGRGTGAARQALRTSGPVKLVAMADAFRDRLDSSYTLLRKEVGEDVEVAEDAKFVGFDAYRRAVDHSDVDLVILATPPGFRPQHFEYAVSQDRHVFMEKPVAVDAPGVRRVLAAAQESKRRNLKVGVGLQRHHDPMYRETLERIRDGAIGDVVTLRVYWNSSGVWVRPRRPQMTEMEYQMRNWYYFNWLCGDHIVEQHIHNLDVGNWVKGAYPVAAQGQGGRQARTGKEYGEIYDHHCVEYTYADGSRMFSQCRHIKGCWEAVAEHAHGTRGTAELHRGRLKSQGGWEWRYRGETPDPYQVEHDRLFAAVREDTPFNETENGALSTLTAILGRMATYSGREVTWEEALASDLLLEPEAYDWRAKPPTVPDDQGAYPIPTPGVTRAL